MRAGGVFHPEFFYVPRRTTSTAELADIEIFQLSLDPQNGWTPGVGIGVTPDTLLWKGKARVQPNKDWRARPREVQFEYDATQAVRVQVPIGKNLVGATWDPVLKRYTSYGEDPRFDKDLRVNVLGGPVKGYKQMEGSNLYVRNAIVNQNLWVYNLLCDTKTSGTEKV